MAAPHLHPEVFVRLFLSPHAMIGPGKAELLAGIARTGSISAAGRDMGMSYKRAWMLVEELNAMFAEPLVTSARGGPGGGGAALTGAGHRVLSLYREIEAQAASINADRLAALRGMLARPPAAQGGGAEG